MGRTSSHPSYATAASPRSSSQPWTENCPGYSIVKGVIDERGGKDVDLDEFDASTFSGDRFYDIFDNEEEIIKKCSIVWVNTNKKFWEGRVIIYYSSFGPVSVTP